MIGFVERHSQKIYLLLFFAGVAFLYTLPIFWNIDYWGIQDWDLHFLYNGVPRVTLLEYGQFPLWNPYFLGGTAMLAHPESQFLTPSFLFVLMFGEVVGLKISIWLHLVIGLGGSYALGRHYNLDKTAALVTAFVFGLNSMFALAFTVGMTWFLSVAYLPWAFLFYLKSFTEWRYGLVSGLFLALMFFTGAAYPLPITLLFFGVYGFILIIFREYSLLKVVRLLAVTVVFMLCFGAIKFFPSIEFQRTYPRTLYDYSGYSLNSLRYSLFSRDQSLAAIANLSIEQPGFINGATGGMDENGIYIGLIPFTLFVLGIGLHSRRRFFLLVVLLIFVWLSFGNRPQAELWSLLHLLPFYKAMRIAQRFRIILVLCLAIFAGFGFQTFKSHIFRVIHHREVAQFVTLVILLFILSDFMIVNWPVFKDAFSIPPIMMEKSEIFHQIWELPAYDKNGWITSMDEAQTNLFKSFNQFHLYSSYGSVYPAFLANLGTINVITSTPVPREATPISNHAYQGEFYLQDTDGTVSLASWTPNRLRFNLDIASPGYLVVNQNYYAGWDVVNDQGREVEALDNLLAVKVFPDDKVIDLRYRPVSFVVGTIVSIVAAIAGLGLFYGKPNPIS